MIKKYYSTDEFYELNPATGEKQPYTGYVQIENGVPYKFGTSVQLVTGDNYISTITLSDEYFDRNLGKTLELPYSLNDCTFAANDYLKSSVINRIIANLDANNRYIYKNCSVSRNDLPVSDIIPVLAPWRTVENDSKTLIVEGDSETPTISKVITQPYKTNVSGWKWSNISYNFINNINEKSGTEAKPLTGGSEEWSWPKTVWGHNWTTDNITDSAVALTTEKTSDGKELYIVFIAEKDCIRPVKLYLYPDDKLSRYRDPLIDNVDNETELDERTFDTSYFNLPKLFYVNPTKDDPDASFAFRHISGLSLDGNFLYVVDSELNGIFKYDITEWLSGKKNANFILINKLCNIGVVTDRYGFNQPSSITAFNNKIAVLDFGNRCVKVFDNDFNHLMTIGHGAFTRQVPKIVQLCPYGFKFENKVIEPGAIFVFSEVGDSFSVDIYSNDFSYIGTKQIKYVTKIKDYYPFNAKIDSDAIMEESIIKIEFSVNDSNLFYIITNRRIIKFCLSNLNEPIGVSLLLPKIIAGEIEYGIRWTEADSIWSNMVDPAGDPIIWEKAVGVYPLDYPLNHCFSICFNPNINSDIIFNITNNTIRYTSDKLIHRCDMLGAAGRPLYELAGGTVTYNKTSTIDGTTVKNKPVTIRIGDKVEKYVPEMDDGSLVPKHTGELFDYILESTFARTYNAIMFYKEPNNYQSLLLQPNLKLYTLDEISTGTDDEYVSQVTFNKILYKILFNLNELKQYICGTFTAGYSTENIMTYNDISLDFSILSSGFTSENFIMGENERVSIVLNRCFENIYRTQADIINKIQTKFINSTEYNLHSYKQI